MNSTTFGQLVFLGYVVAGLLIIRRSYTRSKIPFRAWWLYAILRVYVPFFYHWRSNKPCPFPEEGPAIILANHRSPLDPLMIWMNHHHCFQDRSRTRRIAFLMAREYYELPGIKFLCAPLDCIPVDRNGQDIGPAKEALRKLAAGRLVGIFPEGRLNRGTNLLPANPGIAWLALRAKVPVFPVFIHGVPQPDSMVKPFYTFAKVHVTYGEPIDLSAYEGKKPTQPILREVTDLLMRKLSALGGVAYEPDLHPQGEESVETLPLQAPGAS